MENYNHNCLVFATHKLDEGILDYLAYLKKEVEGVMDLLVLYDQSAHPIKEDDYPGFRFCFFESVGLKGFFHQNERLLPNTFVALAECAEQYRYDHYLLMENDIVLHGDFRRFVQRVMSRTRWIISILPPMWRAVRKNIGLSGIYRTVLLNIFISLGVTSCISVMVS